MSERTDVVVIGAGAIGSAMALKLRGLGAKVLLVDGGAAGSGTTGNTFSWFNASSKVRLKYPAEYFELNKAAIRYCYQLSNELDDGSWLHPIGNLEVASGDEVEQLRSDVRKLLARDYPVQLVDPTEAVELEPMLRMPAGSVAAFYPHEGWIDGSSMVQALLHQIRKIGGNVIESDAVVRFEIRNGRVASAELASGRVLQADFFVLAAGVATQDLAGRVDVSIPLVERTSPQVAGLLVHYQAKPNADRLHRIVHTNGAAVRPNGDGQLLMVGIDGDPGLTLATGPDDLADKAATLLQNARVGLPMLDRFTTASSTIGVRALPIDRVSIIGRAPGVDGLYVAVTHSGITLAAYIAELAAPEILQATNATVLEPFRPGRFVRPDPPQAALVH